MLIGKLLEIQYIDLAEEVVYTVDRIADDCPLAVLRSGGLAAILQFLDFFSNSVQRKCITAASKILGPWKATELDGKLDEKSLFESFVQPGRIPRAPRGPHAPHAPHVGQTVVPHGRGSMHRGAMVED